MIKNNSLKMGLFYSPVGISMGAYVAATANGDGYGLFPLYAGLAAFSTFTVLWWLIVRRKNNLKVLNGAIAGVLSGIVSHYVCWYLLLVEANIKYILLGKGLSSLGEPPQNLIQSFWGALVLSAVSLFLCGWFTVSTGGMIGAAFCWRSKRKATNNGNKKTI